MSRHSSDSKVGDFTVDRVKVDLMFDGSKEFFAIVVGERLKATSLDRLKDKLRDRLRAGALQLAIPAALIDADEDTGKVTYTEVELTGASQTGYSGRVLYRLLSDGPGAPVRDHDGYRNEFLTLRLKPAAVEKVRQLVKAVYDSKRAWERWSDDVRLEDGGKTLIAQEKQKLIDAAVQAKPDTPATPDPDQEAEQD